ncbi:MAG: ATP-grasp domain-containing protein [Paracoccaceae bacterium]
MNLNTTSRVEPPQTVLLLGNYRPALTVARSLHAQGYRVVVSKDRDAGAASKSKAVAEIWETPETAEPKQLYQALAGFLADRPDIQIVFPLMESYVRAFYGHAELLPEDRVYVMPNRDAVEVCLDKGRLIETVDNAGLPCARAITVHNFVTLMQAVEDLGYPLVIKPSDSTVWLGNRKALILHGPGDFAAAFSEWPTEHQSLIVQHFVDGPRINLYFAASGGQAIRYLAVQIGETDIADGTGLATTGTTIELDGELQRLGDALIAQLDYHGIGCIQFLRDRHSGRLSFLEINPRIGGNHAITALCGLDLDTVALPLAAGERVDTNLVIGPAGHVYAWTTGALRGFGLAVRQKEIGVGAAIRQALSAVWLGLRTRHHITFRWNDPLPTLTLLLRLIPGVGHRG